MQNIEEKKSKIITICGSMKFKDEMIKVALQMELAGNVVLAPSYPINDDTAVYTEKEIILLGKMHKEKIKLSDAIFVVNVNGYIGDSTKIEIEYAKMHNKEIIYLEQEIKEQKNEYTVVSRSYDQDKKDDGR